MFLHKALNSAHVNKNTNNLGLNSHMQFLLQPDNSRDVSVQYN